MYELPSYVWGLVLTGVIGIPALTSIVLHRGAIMARLGKGRAIAVAGAAATALGGWILASALLAGAGVYHEPSGQSAPWFGAAFAGTLIALLLATRIPAISRMIADPASPALLALPHTLRIIGVTFLIVMFLGQVPAVFALPAGLGDMATGIAAPFVAMRLAREPRRTAHAVWFNALGLADLVIALTIGFLAGLGPWQLIDVTPTTEALSLLPLALIPTTAVPLAIALHIVSLARLRKAATAPADHGEEHPSSSLVPAGS